jgi:hypothetical protein
LRGENFIRGSGQAMTPAPGFPFWKINLQNLAEICCGRGGTFVINIQFLEIGNSPVNKFCAGFKEKPCFHVRGSHERVRKEKRVRNEKFDGCN